MDLWTSSNVQLLICWPPTCFALSPWVHWVCSIVVCFDDMLYCSICNFLYYETNGVYYIVMCFSTMMWPCVVVLGYCDNVTWCIVVLEQSCGEGLTVVEDVWIPLVVSVGLEGLSTAGISKIAKSVIIPLADFKVSVYCLSTYKTDYVLVSIYNINLYNCIQYVLYIVSWGDSVHAMLRWQCTRYVEVTMYTLCWGDNVHAMLRWQCTPYFEITVYTLCWGAWRTFVILDIDHNCLQIIGGWWLCLYDIQYLVRLTVCPGLHYLLILSC